jgi:CheY-like chemotaxis protein
MRINADSPEKMSSHVRQVGKLVETAAELTSRLLGFARGGKYQISVLDIHQVISMALDIFKPAHKGVRIMAQFEPRPLAVDGDSSQLEQVFLNLLVNSAQAMVDSGTIHVTTRKIHIDENNEFPFQVVPGFYAEISVRDEGIGMDEETCNKVFDPFFSTKTAGNQKGRGLGLSTVYGIVKNHGGFITVDSKKGQGSDFRVCLPCSTHPPDLSQDAEENILETMPKGCETVLFVDDEEAIVNLGKTFLEKLGYQAVLARNGKEAVTVFRQHRQEISLVVLDLILPDMGGKAVFSELRKIRPDVKVLVSTGFNVDEDFEAILNQGCHGFLQKPFSMHRFSQTIRKILDRTEACGPGK